MADRIAVHVPDNGKCLHCGTPVEDFDKKSCLWRDAPARATPPSVMSDFDALGARLKELREQEAKALAGNAIPEAADF